MVSRDRNSSARGYGRRWQKFRLVYLKENPLCVYCKDEGNIVAAEVVDHINPHKGDVNLFWNKNNLQALCKVHHDRTKQIMERGTDKPLIGVDGFPMEK